MEFILVTAVSLKLLRNPSVNSRWVYWYYYLLRSSFVQSWFSFESGISAFLLTFKFFKTQNTPFKFYHLSTISAGLLWNNPVIICIIENCHGKKYFHWKTTSDGNELLTRWTLASNYQSDPFSFIIKLALIILPVILQVGGS